MKTLLSSLGLVLILGIMSAFQLKSGQTQEAPAEKSGGIEWMTFEEAMERSKTEPRKIMVDLYTDWCGWCKKMDANTFSNDIIGEYVNDKWYAVKFDAEQKEPVSYKGKEYNFVPSGRRGYNELAHELTKGRLSYPTIVYLDEKGDVIQAMAGYKDAYSLDKILRFFGDNHFQEKSWVDFQTKYRSPINKVN